MHKNILFTGGGTAGHITPNLEIIPFFLNNNWDVIYIGSKKGMEGEIINKANPKIKYFIIHSGKLRRYLSWQNIIDFFLIFIGIFEAFFIIKKQKVDVIFSKGGFVSFPVVVAGWLNRVPVLIHESDVTPGLANRMSGIFTSKILTTFEETKKYIKNDKTEYIGPIIRNVFKKANPKNGLEYCGFDDKKPVLLVMGGSLGAESINKSIRKNLDKLLKDFQIVHICGKGWIDPMILLDGYKQFEYVNEQFPNIVSMSELVVSRAGSNSIFEYLFMQKPMILVPLPSKSSRGDQIINAEIFREKGYCEIIKNEDLDNDDLLISNIKKVYSEKNRYIENMQNINFDNNTLKVLKIINKFINDL